MSYKVKSFVVVLKVLRKLSEIALPRPYISKFCDGGMPPELPPPNLERFRPSILRVRTPSKSHATLLSRFTSTNVNHSSSRKEITFQLRHLDLNVKAHEIIKVQM